MGGPTERKDFADDVAGKLNLGAQQTTQEPKKAPDEIDNIESAFYRGERMKAFKRGAGIHDEPDHTNEIKAKSEEKVTYDLAATIKAIGEILPKNGQNDVLTKFLLERQDKLETLLKDMAGERTTPQQALKEQLDIQRQIDQEYKQRLGITGTGGTASLPELKMMAEIEQMKSDREEKKLQHEKDMELIRQRYEEDKAAREKRDKREDDKWLAEFNLKKEELKTGQDRADNNMEALTKFGTVLVGSMDQRTGFGTKAPVEQVAPAPQPQASDFTCPNPKCNKVTAVPDSVAEFDCSGCGEHYKAE